MGRYDPRPARLAVSSQLAKLNQSQKFMTLWRWYSYDTLLKRLAYDLERMAFECGLLIRVPNPVMGQGCPFRGRFPIANGTSWKFSASRLRRVSQAYNLQSVLDLTGLALLAARR
jgi:hypothetical protein